MFKKTCDPVLARQGTARPGEAGQGRAGLGKAGRGLARRGLARLGEARGSMGPEKEQMEKVQIQITGTTPLLMHADSIDWADTMEAWKNDPANKTKSKAGDDRTPPWRWIGCLNFDDPKTGIVTIPSEYIMRSIMGGAAEVTTGKGKKTFKAQSQSGLLCSDFHWPLKINGKTISMSSIQECMKMKSFKEQIDHVEKLGFSLFSKRASIGAAKHIRVRPRFDNWSALGELTIMDDQITVPILQTILDISGRVKGLGDWRPGGKTPGPWGMYTAIVRSI